MRIDSLKSLWQSFSETRAAFQEANRKRLFSQDMLSRSTTNGLIRRWEFWLANEPRSLFVVVGLVISFFVLLCWGIVPLPPHNHAEFVSLSFQLVTFAVGGRLLYQGMRLLTRMTIEIASARVIEQLAQKEIDQMNKGDEIDLDNLKAHLIPNLSEPNLTTERLVYWLHLEACHGHAIAREAVVQSSQAEYASRLLMVQNWQRYPLNLGITGTFLGLCFAMRPLGTISQSGFDKSVSQELFDALTLCFSTSVVGLVVSICLTFLVSQLFGKQREFEERLDALAMTVIDALQTAQNQATLTKTFEHMKARMGSLEEKIRLQTQVIAQGLDGLKVARTDLDSFLTGVKQIRETMLDTLDAISKRICTALDTQTRQSEAGADKLTTLYGAVEENFRITFQSMEAHVNRSLSAVAENLSRTLREETALLVEENQTVRDNRETFRKEQEEAVAHIRQERGYLTTVAEQQMQLLASLQAILDQFRGERLDEKILSLVRETNREMTDAFAMAREVLKSGMKRAIFDADGRFFNNGRAVSPF